MENFFNSFKYSPNQPLIFNSVLFFILFTVFYLLYIAVFNKIKARNILLLIFSFYFYYKVSGPAVILLLIMASSDYFIGLGIFKAKKQAIKGWLLLLSLIINLGCLCYFKYTNFFLQTWLGITQPSQLPLVLNILLPIGISFYVFKTLSYVLDVYRDVIEYPERNYFSYLLYVSFFPNILAGPISKARDLLPQINKKLFITNEFIGKGFFLIMCGAFKKVFIADFLAANFVDRVFQSPNLFSGFENLMASYGATIQIYADFSGYTDIVIGIAFLLGFSIDANFNKPFLAKNITDFWRRWHMTLSKWLNEYLYTPLSFSFRKLRRIGIIFSLLITFFLSGFWHGPSWTYILWGLSHGIAMSYDILSDGFRDKIKKVMNIKVYNFISIFITFHFLSFSIILFKSADLTTARVVYSKIFNNLDFSLAKDWVRLYSMPFMVMVLAYILHYLPMSWNNYLTSRYTKLNWVFKTMIFVFAILFIYQAYSSEAMPFVYLEF